MVAVVVEHQVHLNQMQQVEDQVEVEKVVAEQVQRVATMVVELRLMQIQVVQVVMV